MSQTQFDPIDTAAAIIDAFNAVREGLVEFPELKSHSLGKGLAVISGRASASQQMAGSCQHSA